MNTKDTTRGKNIVICCDGTRAKYDSERKNTNVVRLFERLIPDGSAQISYYDPGAGTYSPMWTPLGQALAKGIESASGVGITGTGVRQNIVEAYRYLMDNYEKGDKVFLFGYSRGAYTVRALAGMLHLCGLLTKGSYNLIPYMAEMYYYEKTKVAMDFRERCSRKCPTYFIGVWDTVASVGYVRQKQFSNSVLNSDVSFGYQALAINERRYFFQPSLWDEGTGLGEQTIEQVWFAGCHGDVGGQDADRGISDISLEWMLSHAKSCGLEFRSTWQDDLCPNPLATVRESDTGFWSLGAEDRAICDGAKIHKSVFDRIESLGDRPPNLPSLYSVVETP